MKGNHVLVYLGILALLLVVGLVGRLLHDESQQVELSTWVPLAMLVAVFLLRYFFLRRSSLSTRSQQPAGESERPTTEVPMGAKVPARPLNMRRVLLLVALGAACVIFAWFCLIRLGKVGGGEDSHTTALMGIRLVTSVVTAITALLLSRSASAAWADKRWVFQLLALSQVALAFVGLLIVPFVALGIWNGHIDFAKYPQKLGFFFLLLPTAAVIYCLARDSGSKE